uniref:ADF-H domain-containing protein n=1 Tax=Sander lucioperca TaxID=283035 RepID=A0A8D0ATU0_SANLU
ELSFISICVYIFLTLTLQHKSTIPPPALFYTGNYILACCIKKHFLPSICQNSCTFIVYSYKYVHADGRVSYPLCFIFSSPMGCKPEQQMMYAGSKNQLVQAAELTKTQTPYKG